MSHVHADVIAHVHADVRHVVENQRGCEDKEYQSRND